MFPYGGWKINLNVKINAWNHIKMHEISKLCQIIFLNLIALRCYLQYTWYCQRCETLPFFATTLKIFFRTLNWSRLKSLQNLVFSQLNDSLIIFKKIALTFSLYGFIQADIMKMLSFPTDQLRTSFFFAFLFFRVKLKIFFSSRLSDVWNFYFCSSESPS